MGTITAIINNAIGIITMPNKHIKYKTFKYIELITKVNSSMTLNALLAGFESANVGNYVLFSGQYSLALSGGAVYALDTALTNGFNAGLSVGRCRVAAATTKNYAFFGGGSGFGSSSSTYYNTVDTYNTSLTRSNPTGLSVARSKLAATSIGNYAIFGGGSNTVIVDTVDAYNQSLVRSTPATLSVARYGLAATSIGNYALFGGGQDTGDQYWYSDVVDAYNTSLVRTNPTGLYSDGADLAATSTDEYALFGGGFILDGQKPIVVNSVTAYDSSLTKTLAELSTRRSNLTATTLKNVAMFAGGQNDDSTEYYDTVDIYNNSLVRDVIEPLAVPRSDLSGGSVGDYALFVGGRTYDWKDTSTIDVYTA